MYVLLTCGKRHANYIRNSVCGRGRKVETRLLAATACWISREEKRNMRTSHTIIGVIPVARDIKLKIDLTIVMKFNKNTQKIGSRLVLSLEFELLLNFTLINTG